jgi:hypothetical protein
MSSFPSLKNGFGNNSAQKKDDSMIGRENEGGGRDNGKLESIVDPYEARAKERLRAVSAK